MSTQITEQQLGELGLIIDPTDHTKLIRLDEIETPTKNWGLEQLACFAGSSLRQVEANHLAAVRLSRTSAVSFFWAGRALNLAKKLLKRSMPKRNWLDWLEEQGIKTTTASKAMRLARFAETVQNVEGMTLTAVLRKYGILPPRDEKQSVATTPAKSKPNGAPKTKRKRSGSPDARRKRGSARNPRVSPKPADDDLGDHPDGEDPDQVDLQIFASVWGDEGGDEGHDDDQISTLVLQHLAYFWDFELTNEAIEAGAEIPAGMIQALKQRDWDPIRIPQLDKLAAWLIARKKVDDTT